MRLVISRAALLLQQSKVHERTYIQRYVALDEEAELMNDVRQLSRNGALAYVACMEPISILLYTRMYILSNRRDVCCLQLHQARGFEGYEL